MRVIALIVRFNSFGKFKGNSFAHALFYLSQKPGGISNDKKKWPHIPWRKSRRNCNIVAAVYAGCFPSNIINIAVLVPKAWIASLFSAFNNGSHAKLCRGSVLPCSIALSSPPLQKICCRVFTLPLRIRNVSSSEQYIYSILQIWDRKFQIFICSRDLFNWIYPN